MNSYTYTTDRLADRIFELSKTRPEVLQLTDPWALFAVPGFDCRDLKPSFGQAVCALAQAKQKAGRAA
jgi:hypothetical protein